MIERYKGYLPFIGFRRIETCGSVEFGRMVANAFIWGAVAFTSVGIWGIEVVTSMALNNSVRRGKKLTTGPLWMVGRVREVGRVCEMTAVTAISHVTVARDRGRRRP